jgi:hypothetical protein
MEEGLKLKISADLGQTIAALREMHREVAKTGAGASTLGKGVTGAAAKMPELTKGTAQATFAITNFGRVASDAPYGLIGISNNIEPLVQSFVSLRKETGSASLAFKALGSSLVGGGGLILAVSLLSSAMSFLAVGFDRWVGSSKKAKEGTKELNDELSQIGKKLSTEFQQVGSIVSLVQNYNLSKKEQATALKKLNELSPEYFGNLKTEKDLVDKLSTAYFLYSNALINVFRAKAKEKELSKISDELLKTEEQIIKIETIAKQQRIPLSSVRLQDEQGRVQNITTLYRNRFELQQRFNNLVKEINGLTFTEIKKGEEKNKKTKS